MNTKTIHKLLLAGSTILVLIVALSLLNSSRTPASANNVLGLQAPHFVGMASAAGVDTTSETAFLEDEAGISAYTYISQTIDLSAVRDQFRTIERETSEYIVGSVGIPDYTENFDPHVYVHTDGWVVAYYLTADPASMIVDLRHYDGVSISTMLESAIDKLLTVIGVVTFEVNYYDFRYPNASNLMLIVEAIFDDAGTDSFEVKLPSDFSYYERSWTHVNHQTYSTTNSTLYLNGVEISYLPSTGQVDLWLFNQSTFTAAQLPPGVFHTIQLEQSSSTLDPDSFVSLALIYQEVP